MASTLRELLKSPLTREAAGLVVFAAQASCIHYCLTEYLVEVMACQGPSMLPTFRITGDVVLLEKVTVQLQKRFCRGDVVIVKSPTAPEGTVCKRIRGLAGDLVVLNQQVSSQRRLEVTVPAGHVWLEGDNSSNSSDSRYYGPVPMAMVRGRVFFKLYPLSEFGFIQSIEPKAERQGTAFQFQQNREPQTWSSSGNGPYRCRAIIKYREDLEQERERWLLQQEKRRAAIKAEVSHAEGASTEAAALVEAEAGASQAKANARAAARRAEAESSAPPPPSLAK